VGPRTDVYGLGALLYTLLLRRPPFPGDKPLEVVGRVASEQTPPRLALLRPDVPDLLDRVCMKCLSKDPQNRFVTAREVAVALRTCHLAAVVTTP
jgi:serine/threonine protein kinase